MRFSIRAIAAVLAIAALLFALSMPASADVLCAVLVTVGIGISLQAAGRVCAAGLAVPQLLRLLSVPPSRGPPLQ